MDGRPPEVHGQRSAADGGNVERACRGDKERHRDRLGAHSSQRQVGAGNDQPHHRILHEEPLADLGGLCRAGDLGLLGAVAHAHRRHSRPEREPGHRLHRVAGAQPARSRRPGYLPAHREPAGAAACAHRPFFLGVWILDGERHLRGLCGHLLCPHPRPGAAQPGG